MQFTISLKQNHIFRRLYAKGSCAVGRTAVIYSRKNGTEQNRLGFSVSTKLGHAVARNRIRRRLREAYRLNEHLLSPGYDMIIVARGRAAKAEFTAIEAELLRLCRNLGIAQEE